MTKENSKFMWFNPVAGRALTFSKDLLDLHQSNTMEPWPTGQEQWNTATVLTALSRGCSICLPSEDERQNVLGIVRVTSSRCSRSYDYYNGQYGLSPQLPGQPDAVCGAQAGTGFTGKSSGHPVWCRQRGAVTMTRMHAKNNGAAQKAKVHPYGLAGVFLETDRRFQLLSFSTP